MENNNTKPWDRPWTTEEIIQNSDNWNLGGDAALLTTVQNFANNLLFKTNEISDDVDKLLNGLNEIEVKLDIAKNDFSSLRNSQFIESRVYEDDETLEVKEDLVEQLDNVVTEGEKERRIRDVIERGLKLMDKYYDKVQVPISDSEDDVETSYVLKAKDFYEHRPLPYIIGSEEWLKEHHIGLEDSDVETESEKSVELYSSDSESDLSESQIKASESSSELDFSTQRNTQPVANSTFNDSVKQPDLFGSSSDSDQNSLPVDVPQSSKSFAEQLAEKLGGVITEEPEINRKPIKKTEPKPTFGLFSDEPPPLDDLEDTILPSDLKSGFFSGGKGLFDDDDEDEPLFNAPQKQLNRKPVITENADKPKEDPPTKQSIFDSDSDEEDFFTAPRKPPTKPTFLQPASKPADMPLFDDEPPELSPKKKPAGGVRVLNPADLKIGDLLKKRRSTSSDTSESEQEEKKTEKKVEEPKKIVDKTEEVKQPKKVNLFDDTSESEKEEKKTEKKIEEPKKIIDKTEEVKQPKKVSLFDDTDDLFDDDLFSTKPTKKFTSSLFDDDDDGDDDPPPPIVESAKEETPKRQVIGAETPKVDFSKTEDEETPKQVAPKPKVSLFDSTPPPDDDWDATSEPDPFEDLTNEAPSSLLFDNVTPLWNNAESGIGVANSRVESASESSSFNPILDSTSLQSSDIFDEQQSEDSMFVTKNKTESSLGTIPEITKSAEEISDLEITPSGKLEDLESSEETNKTIDKTDNKDKDNVDGVLMRRKIKSPVDMNIASLKEKLLQNVDTSNVVRREKKTGSPGKLRLSLNIDVNALRPGGPGYKKKEVPKTEGGSGAPPPIRPRRPYSEFLPDRIKIIPGHPDLGSGDSEILHCITKDRAKIQVKRRPPTKKGRDLLRRSIAEFNEDVAIAAEVSTVSTIEEKVTVSTEEKVTVGGKQIKEKSLFDEKEEESSKSLFNKAISILNDFEESIEEKKEEKSLFDEDEKEEMSSKALFDEAKSILDDFEESIKERKEKSLFEDDDKEEVTSKVLLDEPKSFLDDDDELFAAPVKTKSKGLFDDSDDEELITSKKLSVVGKKSSLFDDEDDDDDLFSSSSKKTSSSSSAVTKTRTVKKTTNVSTVTDDPLSTLQED